MLHIYRQITALQRVKPIVLARKRESPEGFPFDDVTLVPRPPTQFFRRIWYRQIRQMPWTIGRRETAALLDVLERREAQLLHIYFGHIAVHLLPLMQQWQHPSVVSFHGADVMVDLEKPPYRAATLSMLESARLVLVRSQSLADALVKLGCGAGKVRIQRTGIPLDELPFRARAFPPPDGAWQLLQACRLIEKKGLATSLRAFAKFARQYPDARFTIAGDGMLLAQLQETARALGVSDRVDFVGFVSQEALRELFYRAHIFLHPSETGPDGNQEGVPNSMLEAMATGLPVFATMHGGLPEAIENEVSGVLVCERDADALAIKLFDAAEKPELLTRLAENGARAVAENFEQSAQIRKLEGYYFEAMQPRPAL